MIAVIIEMTPAEGRADEYFSIAKRLKDDVATIDGFISVERFESVTQPGKLVSISFWRDEAALRQWRLHGRHQLAQDAGRGGIFNDYRVRIASVIRDYGLTDRAQAAADGGAASG